MKHSRNTSIQMAFSCRKARIMRRLPILSVFRSCTHTSPYSPVESSLSDDEGGDEDTDDAAVGRSFSFPDLDQRIRQIIREYGAVFPKLNFSSPKVSPSHERLSPFTSNSAPVVGCIMGVTTILPPQMHGSVRCLPLVKIIGLRSSRSEHQHRVRRVSIRYLESTLVSTRACPAEMASHRQEPRVQVFRSRRPSHRCVPISPSLNGRPKDRAHAGISQRDTNFYDFMNEPQTQQKIVEALQRLWEDDIKSKWLGQQDCAC
jgi:hypothetical protein